MLDSYLKRLHTVQQQGDAREESFYSSFEKLLYAYAEAEGRDDVHVTVPENSLHEGRGAV